MQKNTAAIAASQHHHATFPASFLQLIDTKAAAALLGLRPLTLEHWRNRRLDGPRFIRLSKCCVRYSLSDIKAWLDRQTEGGEARA